MFFKDRNNWQKGILAKSRKQISKAGRLLMALAVGGCLWGQGEVGFATTEYYFHNPSSGNVLTFDENGYTGNNTGESYTSDSSDSSSFPYDFITIGDTNENNVSENNITINGGNYHSIEIPPDGYNSNNNTVTVNNGTIERIIMGPGGSFTIPPPSSTYSINSGFGNIVNINGGTVGAVHANTINIYGGTISQTDMYSSSNIGEVCAYPSSDSATPGEVNIYNAPNLSNALISASNITGATMQFTESRSITDILTDITTGTSGILNIHTKDLTAQNIQGFSNINFYLPSTITNGDTVLTLTNGATYLADTTIRAGVEGNANLSTGDTVTLIKNSNGITTDSTTTYGTLSEGVSLDYDLTVEKADDTSIVARVGNVAPGAGSGSSTTGGTSSSSGGSALKEQTNILPAPLLSSSVLILQGTDRIIDWLPPEDPVLNENISETKQDEEEGKTAKAESPNDFQIFANMGFNRLRTKTGGNSYTDNNSGGFDLGAARTLENSAGKLVFAPIVDYGKGSYDCYSDNGMHGSGNSKYWAGGMIARQMNRNGFYYEASFRAGRASVDFVSDDFLQGGIPTTVSYDVSAPVFAGHVRVGQLYQMGGGHQLHLYGIYSHNHQNGMTAHLSTGETYNFSAVDSGRLRIGARLTWMKKRTQKFYSGIAYQYEYSNGATGSYRGYSTESSNMRGSSAMIELGWQVKPTEQSPWMVDVGATGWVGHQKGFTVQAKLMKSF